MFQNIKVDIAYYKTNTDFEMEFNLCGCCRMRLLTDKAPDKKTLVHSLARAVSRSRVIIIVGKLFGEDGIINIAASATGSKLSVADNKAYGISTDDKIEIINGSTPLVTPEGYFGGCIMEKGPQTMILLTENKNVRKAVMKNLIHPYIEELCALDLKAQAASANEGVVKKETEEIMTEENAAEASVAENSLPEIELPELPDVAMPDFTLDEPDGEEEEIVEEAGEYLIETEEENESEENLLLSEELEDEPSDYITETEEEAEEYEDDMGLITDEDDYEEIEMQTPDSSEFASFDDDEMSVESDMLYDDKGMSLKDYRRRNAEYYKDDESFEGLLTDEDEFDGNRIHGGFGLPIMIVSILLLILIIVLCYCIFYVPSTEGVSASAYIKETFDILFG